MASRTAHHHVISRGYQRLFADGELILRIDKQTRTAIVIGTADAFVERHFNSRTDVAGMRDDSLEHEWALRENECLPIVRGIVAGVETRPAVRDAIKVLAAIHFARSFAFAEMSQRIAAEVTEAHATEGDRKEHLRRAFREQYGREPLSGEIETVIRRCAEEQFGGRRQLVQGMKRAHDIALQKLAPSSVQLVWRRRSFVDFVFGDQPVVHMNGPRAGLRQLPFGEANSIFIPIGPHVVASFTTQPQADTDISPADVQRINLKTWQATRRYLACHPTADASASLVTSIADPHGKRV